MRGVTAKGCVQGLREGRALVLSTGCLECKHCSDLSFGLKKGADSSPQGHTTLLRDCVCLGESGRDAQEASWSPSQYTRWLSIQATGTCEG